MFLFYRCKSDFARWFIIHFWGQSDEKRHLFNRTKNCMKNPIRTRCYEKNTFFRIRLQIRHRIMIATNTACEVYRLIISEILFENGVSVSNLVDKVSGSHIFPLTIWNS